VVCRSVLVRKTLSADGERAAQMCQLSFDLVRLMPAVKRTQRAWVVGP
jgi:hypothetical protein